MGPAGYDFGQYQPPEQLMTGLQTTSYVAPSGSPDFSTFTFPACYLPGTHIQTIRGEVAVEDLQIGDILPTLSGKDMPIKWIGKQKSVGYFVARDRSPVCIHAGALGAGLPKRDLFVSPGHSIHIGGHLVDARLLVNGVTITQQKRTEEIEYFHIDLGDHHCILAEGSWAESYAECDNRDTFYNVDEFYEAHPDHELVGWTEKCLPHIADHKDPRLAGLFNEVLTYISKDFVKTEADVHLLADGKRINPIESNELSYTFKVPANTRTIRLKSRTSSPRELGISTDSRQLGVCINSIVAQSEDGSLRISVEPHHAKLRQGFNNDEGPKQRWTQGDALLPSVLLGNGSEDMIVTVHARTLTRYHISQHEVPEVEPPPRLRMVH